MAKRRKFSRWRRLPATFRFGDDKPPDLDLEPQRLTLYISGGVYDRAAAQAAEFGFENIQEYCASILLKAVDAEHVRGQVADVEARRGTLEGLHEIADDPEYLADLSAAASPRDRPAPRLAAPRPDGPDAAPVRIRLNEAPAGSPPDDEIQYEPDPPGASAPGDDPSAAGLPLRYDRGAAPGAGGAAEVVIRHAGQGADDPLAFLPCLRRGEPAGPAEVGELARALQALERDFQGEPAIDRRLAFALHRLAYESQILHTDAWPGSFDGWTLDVLRAVQEAVERILSGQDIRYYPEPEPEPAPRSDPLALPEVSS